MDDMQVISCVVSEMMSFELNIVHNINENYIKNKLELKYINKIYGTLYVTGIDNVSFSNNMFQNPHDSNYVIKIKYSIVGISYFKGMNIAFVVDNIIRHNDQTFFTKKNVIAIINKVIIKDNYINNKLNPIIITRVINEPNYVNNEGVIKVGLICEVVDIIDRTDEKCLQYNCTSMSV